MMAWGIHDGKRLLLETIRSTKALCTSAFTNFGKWSEWQAKGYSCIPVKVEGRPGTDRIASVDFGEVEARVMATELKDDPK